MLSKNNVFWEIYQKHFVKISSSKLIEKFFLYWKFNSFIFEQIKNISSYATKQILQIKTNISVSSLKTYYLIRTIFEFYSSTSRCQCRRIYAKFGKEKFHDLENWSSHENEECLEIGDSSDKHIMPFALMMIFIKRIRIACCCPSSLQLLILSTSEKEYMRLIWQLIKRYRLLSCGPCNGCSKKNGHVVFYKFSHS